jgi:hypothetical protein
MACDAHRRRLSEVPPGLELGFFVRTLGWLDNGNGVGTRKGLFKRHVEFVVEYLFLGGFSGFPSAFYGRIILILPIEIIVPLEGSISAEAVHFYILNAGAGRPSVC